MKQKKYIWILIQQIKQIKYKAMESSVQITIMTQLKMTIMPNLIRITNSLIKQLFKLHSRIAIKTL